MTEVATNYTINMTEVTANFNEGEEFFQPSELEEAIKMSMKEGDDQNLCTAGEGKNKQAPGVVGVPLPTPVNPTDPHVIEIAKFAVKKHNEQARTHLVFVKVVGGIKWSVVAVTFYLLIIQVKGPKGTHNAKALVAETITGYKKLIYWKD